MFLYVITKNLKWEILTGIQSLLKDEMRLKRENFIILQAHQKIHFLGNGGGGHTKNNIYIGGTCLKGGLGEFADLRERVWQKRAMHFMQIISSHQAEFSYLAFFELV